MELRKNKKTLERTGLAGCEGTNSARSWLASMLTAIFLFLVLAPAALAASGTNESLFPKPLQSYPRSETGSLTETLFLRAKAEPFNILATLLFFGAVLHTFAAPWFSKKSHKIQQAHAAAIEREGRTASARPHLIGGIDEVSFKAQIFHFFGEVEAVFGLWVIPLLICLAWQEGWETAKNYLNHREFTEPMFVVIIMAIAASRPILQSAEKMMSLIAQLGKGTAAAWWFAIMTAGPLLGSFITEPAAMTISAMLLCRKFYDRCPSPRFAYGTLGLLFVNVSVGGTLTHFAAPPVLMVAKTWNWDTPYMASHFGWKAILGIFAANLLYYFFFKSEFRKLQPAAESDGDGRVLWESRNDRVPVWIILVHIFFLAWTVFNSHYPVLFIGAFLFFLAFTEATEHHQNPLQLRPALLVGFFLAGLVIHGGLQGWWIEPVLGSLSQIPLFFGATILTAFNDNAAITYLASFVPNLSEGMKYAVVAGAVTGGGLTVIANAPNPAGQSILAQYFPNGISALGLLLGALIPTLVMIAAFLLL